ncbi:hypothetical protein [Aeromicrobium sp. 179-A 4D2 NHS]|uniref:hypothetical protein n=1 Tax=Aeromicrobium sp. 179-A 4D2 NHS TaxID=3142375 RepID=UPI00399F619A
MSEQNETTLTVDDIPEGWEDTITAKVNGILGEWCLMSGCVWIKSYGDFVRVMPLPFVSTVERVETYNPDTHKVIQRGTPVPYEYQTPSRRLDIPDGFKNSIIGRLNGAIGEFCRKDGSIWMKAPEGSWERKMPDEDNQVVEFEPLEVFNPDTHTAVTHEKAEYL